MLFRKDDHTLDISLGAYNTYYKNLGYVEVKEETPVEEVKETVVEEVEETPIAEVEETPVEEVKEETKKADTNKKANK